MAVALALLLSSLSLAWQVASYMLDQRATALHKQTVQKLVDYLADVRTLNKPPTPSGEKLWNRAFSRLRETRRRLDETIGSLPSSHRARKPLIRLQDAFHEWADVVDYYEDSTDTHYGQEVLMEALANLQRERIKAEDILRKDLHLSEPGGRSGLDESGLPLRGKR